MAAKIAWMASHTFAMEAIVWLTSGLADRGAISEGLRADLVLVDPEALRVVATIAGGRIAYLSPAGAARFSASVHTGQSD